MKFAYSLHTKIVTTKIFCFSIWIIKTCTRKCMETWKKKGATGRDKRLQKGKVEKGTLPSPIKKCSKSFIMKYIETLRFFPLQCEKICFYIVVSSCFRLQITVDLWHLLKYNNNENYDEIYRWFTTKQEQLSDKKCKKSHPPHK